MTQREIRMALLLVALVVAVGLALGYGVGLLTRTGGLAGTPPPAGAEAAFDGPSGTPVLANPQGGTLPGYGEVYVNDYADLLDPQAEARIRSVLIELYDHTGVEMTVLTIADMGGFGHYGPIEPFATALFNAWGVGDATRNDGVLVLVARDDRRMRIELGSGYASSHDARMQRVIDNAFLPAFRSDDYQGGIERGVDETVQEIAGVYPGDYDSGTLRLGWSQIWRWLQQAGAWALALMATPLAGFGIWLRRYMRRRARPCQDCGTMLLLAGETADDAHLDGGQKLEEFLKSVDYDVWHCPSCGRIDIHRYRNWFSGYGACPKCAYRTLSTKSTVLSAATKTRSGSKRLDYDCANCGYHNSETRTIPQLSDSSGSGSSRSSFGGGSSSGGGASGSW